ncbi:MAG: hypothetical protein PHH11_18280 [Methylomonas sp.]|nr:hypothetical protein [Methylomonas sp.]
MSCEKGFKAIIDEAEWQMQFNSETLAAFIDTLSAQPSHYYRAMLTYFDHGECWRGATRFFHADSLPYWRKRKNMGHKPAAVEALRRGELHYFFAYPEDYSQQSIEWVDGEFGRRPHNPAFEVVYVYSQKDGTLDLNFRSMTPDEILNELLERLGSMRIVTRLRLFEDESLI